MFVPYNLHEDLSLEHSLSASGEFGRRVVFRVSILIVNFIFKPQCLV